MNIRKTHKSPANIRAQQGWTMWSMMFSAAVVIFFAYIGMQLVPMYSSNANIKNAMKQAIERSENGKVTRSSIIKSMSSQLYLDGSHKLIDFKRDLKVKRSKTQLILEVKYRQEIKLFFNLSLAADFDNVVEKDLL